MNEALPPPYSGSEAGGDLQFDDPFDLGDQVLQHEHIPRIVERASESDNAVLDLDVDARAVKTRGRVQDAHDFSLELAVVPLFPVDDANLILDVAHAGRLPCDLLVPQFLVVQALREQDLAHHLPAVAIAAPYRLRS